MAKWAEWTKQIISFNQLLKRKQLMKKWIDLWMKQRSKQPTTLNFFSAEEKKWSCLVFCGASAVNNPINSPINSQNKVNWWELMDVDGAGRLPQLTSIFNWLVRCVWWNEWAAPINKSIIDLLKSRRGQALQFTNQSTNQIKIILIWMELIEVELIECATNTSLASTFSWLARFYLWKTNRT